MNGIGRHIIIYIVCILISTGCTLRELTYDYLPFCDVNIDVDWSNLEELPTGMTVMFYPVDGATPIDHITHNVEHTTVSLRAGVYNILIFNKSVKEFGSIGFRGMDRYETAEAYALEESSKGWYSKAEDESVALQPEPLAVATIENYTVTEDMVHAQMAARSKGAEIDDKTKVDTKAQIDVKPKNVIAQGNIIIHVLGFHNLRSVRGTIEGMAESFQPSVFGTGEGFVTHILESDDWASEEDESDRTKGRIHGHFSTFGMPEMILSRAGEENRWENARLNISVLLVDNNPDNIQDFSFDIGDKIDVSDMSGEIILHIELGTGADGDEPITLPDVIPEGGKEGGFNVEVDKWGEGETIDVQL